MSPVESRDIFRRLQVSVGLRATTQDNCQLCGTINSEVAVRIICSSCVQCLVNLPINKKQKIYKHLLELGDKKRAKVFSKHFQIFKHRCIE